LPPPDYVCSAEGARRVAVSRWHLYVGTHTQEFALEIARLKQSGTDWWRGNAGTPGSAPKDVPPRDPEAPFYSAGGRLSTGIERFVFDDATGGLEYRETIAGGIASPQYLAWHPRLDVLYALENARTGGRLLAYGVEADGALTLRSTAESLGAFGVAVSVHPSGVAAYAAHWGDGTLSAFSLDDDGTIGAVEPIARGDHRDGARAHHHAVRLNHHANALLVTDVGDDELTVYDVDVDGRVRTPPDARIKFPEGSGPRHIEFDGSGRAVYVVGEWDSVLYVLAAEEGIPTKIVGERSTLPDGFDGKRKGSEARLHPNGRVLYVSDRLQDAVAIFAVDGAGGAELLAQQPAAGQGAAPMRVDPSGRYLLVGNQYSGSIAVFRIDGERLVPVGAPIGARAPRYLTFSKAPAA
jgi:6-phosphogluconolactonase